MTSQSLDKAGPRAIDWMRSLLFWACLFVAAALYAGVVLSPKVLTWLVLRAECAEGQWRLARLESQTAQLRRVVAAQQNDRRFIREQAHAAFDIASPGEQQISVSPHLMLKIGAVSDARQPPSALPAYATLLRRIAGSQRLADGLLVAAGSLVLFAFTFLYERTAVAPCYSEAAAGPGAPSAGSVGLT